MLGCYIGLTEKEMGMIQKKKVKRTKKIANDNIIVNHTALTNEAIAGAVGQCPMVHTMVINLYLNQIKTTFW